MRSKKSVFILTILILFSFAATLYAGIAANIYVGGVGRYLWRGQDLNNSFCFQPGVTVGLNKFSLDWWGSFNSDESQLSESDYKVSFTDGVPFVPIINLTSGYWIYTYPFASHTVNNTQELFATLSADVFSQPYISFYYDPVLGKGSYAEAGVSHEMELFGAGINASVNAGFNFGQYGYERSFTAVTAILGVSYNLSGFKINPSFVGQLSLDEQYFSLATWGLNISYEFGIAEEIKPADAATAE